MKKILSVILVLFASVCYAQNTSTISGTIQDLGGTTWTYASWQANLTGVTNPHFKDGTPATPVVSGTLSAGVISGTLARNDMIASPGTTWTFTICPINSAPCQTITNILVTSANVNVATQINPQLMAISLPSTGAPLAVFNNAEVSNPKYAPYFGAQPVPGQLAYNVAGDSYNYWSTATQTWKPINAALPQGIVMYPAANTLFMYVGDSTGVVDSDSNTVVTSTAWACNGIVCTITAPTTTFKVGQYITFQNETGTWGCLQWANAPILSTGFSSTQFEVSQSAAVIPGYSGCAGTQSGTGGNLTDASHLYPMQTANLPAFTQNETIAPNFLNYSIPGDTIAAMASGFTARYGAYSPNTTGVPTWLIVQAGSNDLNASNSAAIEANFQSFESQAHAEGFKIAVETMPGGGSGFSCGVGCNSYWTYTIVQRWLRSNQCTNSPATTQCADLVVDVGGVTNASDPLFWQQSGTFAGHPTNAGASTIATAIARAFTFKSSFNTSGTPTLGQNSYSGYQYVDPTINNGGWLTSGGAGLNAVSGYRSYVTGDNGVLLFELGQGTAANVPFMGFVQNSILGWANTSGGGLFPLQDPVVGLSMDKFLGGRTIAVGDGNNLSDASGGFHLTFLVGQPTAPTGTCSVTGQWQFTQDGKQTYCNGTTWVNKTPITSTNSQALVITSGICTATGSSYATCTNAAANTWPTAFADTNYSVVCSGINPSNSGGSLSGDIYNIAKTTTGITISLQTNTSSGFTYGEIDCTGTHN